jgi:hypothetical protein
LSRNRDRNRPSSAPSRPTALDEARNDLFGHIHRCGVMQATREQQAEWMKDTIEFLAERHSGLKERDLKELESIGLRFCSPVIANAGAATAPEAGVEQESAAA